MELINFCRAHGILIDSLPPIGVWRRYPTDDHPNKRNGAVKFMGDHAFVQNHAMDTEVSVWQPDTPVKIDRAKIARDLQAVEDKRRADQREAANKAAENRDALPRDDQRRQEERETMIYDRDQTAAEWGRTVVPAAVADRLRR